MKDLLLKILSGGQTGVDLGALKAAKKAGITTGGCLPKGCKTEDGIDLSLKIRYRARCARAPRRRPRRLHGRHRREG